MKLRLGMTKKTDYRYYAELPNALFHSGFNTHWQNSAVVDHASVLGIIISNNLFGFPASCAPMQAIGVSSLTRGKIRRVPHRCGGLDGTAQ